VSDPEGPFDGFAYIVEAHFVLDRTGYTNRYFVKNGPPPATGVSKNFYLANVQQHIDVDAYLERVKAHEGYGAPELGGHMAELVQALQEKDQEHRPLDPNGRIEPLFAEPSEGPLAAGADGLLEDHVDRALKEAASELKEQSLKADKAPPHAGTLELWDGHQQRWVPKTLP
jgi:hypothetical protein